MSDTAPPAALSFKKKIYLAGPDVFLPSPTLRGNHLKAICAAHNTMGLFPLDNVLAPPASSNYHSRAFAAAIRDANMNLIKECDGILANMTPFRGPSMDVGTAYEMGVAAGMGKVVVGYIEGENGMEKYVSKVKKMGGNIVRGEDGHLRDEEGWGVEEFGCGPSGEEVEGEVGLVDNLMVACGIERLCGSAEEGLEVLAGILYGKDKGA